MTVLSTASLDGALLAAVNFVFVPVCVCLGRDGPFGGEVKVLFGRFGGMCWYYLDLK